MVAFRSFPTAPRLEAGLFFTALEQGIAGLRVKKVSYTCFVSGTEELRPPYTSRTRKAGKRNVYSVLCGWQFVLSL